MDSGGSAAHVSQPRRLSALAGDPLAVTAVAFGLVAFAVLALGLLVAIVLPYGQWDAMAYGIWSRLIALHWPHLRFPGLIAVDYHRPLFYILQGWLWTAFGFHQWVGRLLSYAFSCVLVAATAWIAARSVATDRAFAAALAVIVMLVVAPFEVYVAAGLSDIPVAAMVALTGAVLVTGRLGRRRLPLAAAAAALSVLAKPSSLGALLGLGLALLLGSRSELRRRAPALVALAGGTGVGLVYDIVQARYEHMGLPLFLTSGVENAPYYEHLASTLRRTTLLDGSWLGPDLRLFLAFGCLYALARLVLPHRASVAIAVPAAWLWSWLGPHLAGAHGLGAGVLAGGFGVEHIGVLVLGLALLLSLAAPPESVPSRLTLARTLLWAAPVFVSWAWKAVYDIRLLAPAWPALVLLIVWSLVPVFAGARALRRWLVAAPALAAAVLGVYAIYGINGLGRPGWELLRSEGISGLGDSALMRKVGVGGDFAAELNALAPQLGPGDRIVSYDARLQFLYLDRTDIAAPLTCSDLAGHRIFVLLESDEIQAVYGKRAASSAYWETCRHPSLTLVAEHPNAFAVFVAGKPRPSLGECNAPAPQPELLVQFGTVLGTAKLAKTLLRRVEGTGFTGAQVQQLGCALYRVVYPSIPSRAVGKAMLGEARSAGLQARLVGP